MQVCRRLLDYLLSTKGIAVISREIPSGTSLFVRGDDVDQVAAIVQGMVGPALLAIFGACAKYLRDISKDLSDLRVTIKLAQVQLESHDKRLGRHDDSLRELETLQSRSYVS